MTGTSILTPSQHALLEQALAIMVAKRPGYTVCDADPLANFKAVAQRAGVDPLVVWLVYFLKHIDAITTAVRYPDAPVAEQLDGRFCDAINYLLMGWDLVREREITRASTPMTGVD